MDRLRLIAGSSCEELVRAVARRLGVGVSHREIKRYKTGCFEVILKENVRGCHVVLFQTSLPNEKLLHLHLWELLEMVNAAKKASAREVTVVVPYLSYARSDKKWTGRMAITGKLVAAFLEKAGMNRIVGIDFHSPEFEGFFDTETVVDHLRTLPLIVHYLKNKDFSKTEILILPGDEGFHKEAEALGENLGFKVGSVEKTRVSSDKVRIQAVKGEVKDKRIIIYDDEICTGGTVKAITEKVAGEVKGIIVAATHGLFQGNVLQNLSHPLIEEIIITDTVPIPESFQKKLPIKIISIVPLLAAALREIYIGGSISRLFKMDPSEY